MPPTGATSSFGYLGATQEPQSLGLARWERDELTDAPSFPNGAFID